MQGNKERPHPGNASSLRREADTIRRHAVEQNRPTTECLAPWQKILLVPALIFVLTASLVLLTSDNLRKNLLIQIVDPWFATLDQGPEIYRLPPPPPPPSRTELRFSTHDSVPHSGEKVPVDPAVPELEASSTPGPDDFQPEAKTKDWKEAFRILATESEVVAKLLAGEVRGLHFEGWEPLRAEPPRYSIKLDMYSESDLRRIAFAWSVDILERDTRPENQSARDLFFKFRRK